MREDADRADPLFSTMANAVHIVLVRPLYPGNVGSVARAMKNMGFTKLIIVGDQDPRQEAEALWMAHGAEDVLNAAAYASNLEHALSGIRLRIGTSSRIGKHWREALSPDEMVDRLASTWDWLPTAFLFGPEDRGFSASEIEGCDWVVRIPTHPGCPSMNLSHAVVILCYSLCRRSLQRSRADHPAADPGEIRRFLFEAHEMLLKVGFLGTEPKRAHYIVRQIHGLLSRAKMTIPELRLLWALLRYIQRLNA